MKEIKLAPQPWRVYSRPTLCRGFVVEDVSGRAIARVLDNSDQSLAHAYAFAAVPIAVELGDAVIAQAEDGIDRSEFVLQKARQFKATAGGERAE
jgi:hypothetical protein